MKEQQNFCICGLALGKRYRDYAMGVATSLQTLHPGVTYLILTDSPQDFREFANVLAIKHKQDSITRVLPV